ncbi:lectin BRA-3-like [Acanthaster planci]|uniref:Lectin BRA-3-like n=1 Tax=Acanthaster planci TaxID=133434 RepID=A0A8B7YM00_ACAPL|nr:lectin BRA-3-like [Acanthaster planci]
MKIVLVTASLLLLVSTVLAWGETGPKCPRNWFMYNNTKCLMLFTRPERWLEARKQCGFQNPGGDLVIIESEEKKAFVHSMVHYKPPLFSCGLLSKNPYWIGLNDRNHEFVFEWNDTGESGNYRNWAFLEPNNQFGEDCVEMDYDKGKWNDEDCNTKRCFVCEVQVS